MARLTPPWAGQARPPGSSPTTVFTRPLQAGRSGLRNPERGWRIEAVIAEPARKTFGPALHLAGRVAPLYQERSFSLAHSSSEREGQPYSIDHWLSTAIAPEPLRQAAMPVADGWFEDGLGQPATRTQFEYIQDHLGYRLELQSARIPVRVIVGAEFRVEIELVNRGFSTLHNPRPVILVLKDRTGKVTELPVAAADPRQWQPFRPGDAEYRPIVHKITWTGNLPATLTRPLGTLSHRMKEGLVWTDRPCGLSTAKPRPRRLPVHGPVAANRRMFYDFTFSPPKSVSLAAFLGNDGWLLTAHTHAVRSALNEFEAFAATRIRVGGAQHDRSTGNFAAALFTHDTSCALDHTCTRTASCSTGKSITRRSHGRQAGGHR